MADRKRIEKVSKLIEECVEELEAAVSPKSIYRVYPFSFWRRKNWILPCFGQRAGASAVI